MEPTDKAQQLRNQADAMYHRSSVVDHVLNRRHEIQWTKHGVEAAGWNYLHSRGLSTSQINGIWSTTMVRRVFSIGKGLPADAKYVSIKKYKRLKEKSKPLLAKAMRTAPMESERIVWQSLQLWGAVDLKWKFQVPLSGYIADFYCEKLKLVVELDGSYHDDRQQYDRTRDAVFRSKGIHTVRIPSRNVFSDLQAVLRQIKSEWNLAMDRHRLMPDEVETYIMHLQKGASLKTRRQYRGKIIAAEGYIRQQANAAARKAAKEANGPTE